jgi:hypothetical protein
VLAGEVARWRDVEEPHLKITRLPDVWISISGSVTTLPEDDPAAAIQNFIRMVNGVIEEHPPLSESPAVKPNGKKGRRLADNLRDGEIRIVQVSGAELNPRYRGRLEQSYSPALLLLTHCAAALVRSRVKG